MVRKLGMYFTTRLTADGADLLCVASWHGVREQMVCADGHLPPEHQEEERVRSKDLGDSENHQDTPKGENTKLLGRKMERLSGTHNGSTDC